MEFIRKLFKKVNTEKLDKKAIRIRDFKDINQIITKNDNKILIEFLNYDCGGFLGQPVINDGELFAKKLKKIGYICFYICNTTACIAKNILKNLIKLEGRTIVFYYSGHGYYVDDLEGDESDGKDEAFVFDDSLLIDDEFARVINKYLKCEKLICISDSCHSGTVWDVQSIDKDKRNKIICISSCQDEETAKQLDKNGMFSLFFWQCFDDESNMIDIDKLTVKLAMFKQQPEIHANKHTIDF